MAHVVSPRNQTPIDIGIQTSRSVRDRDAALPLLQTSSSDLTQSSVADASDTTAPNLTPTTSSSICSATGSTSRTQSLTRIASGMPAPNHPGAHSAPVPSSVEMRDAPRENPSRTPPRSPSTTSMKLDTPVQPTQGQKRTASGEVKPSGSPAQFQSPRTSLAATAGRQHARTMSTDSNSSKIAEVSALLHSKLSYAAAKLESQWQMRSPESRPNGTGRSYSPTSPGRGLQGSRRSPHLQNRNSENAISHHPISNNRPDGMRSANTSVRQRSSSLSSAQNGSSLRHSASLDMDQIPRLAPPLDIVSGNGNMPRRRPNPNIPANNHNDAAFRSNNAHFHKPSLSQQSSSSSNHTGFGTHDNPPYPQHAYPSNSMAPGGISKERTPSQNTLMEQDAIETLLFLSSPENSGYRANSQNSQNRASNYASLSSAIMPPPSQLNQRNIEATNGRHTRRVSFADNGGASSAKTTHSYNGNKCTKIARRAGLEHHVDDDIDRMLDAMDDSDSDVDEEWVAKLHEHVRDVANRRRTTSSGNPQNNTPSLLPHNG